MSVCLLYSLGLAAFLSWSARAKRGDPDKWCHNHDDHEQQSDQSLSKAVRTLTVTMLVVVVVISMMMTATTTMMMMMVIPSDSNEFDIVR